ncbi:MAG: YggU family protein [Candidatus Muproteobacteria bacterium RIFCSPHIGHO2_01_FULL_65_16]|uniref:UPF0235 protein A2637_02595 n=1 Tax=Candidatus Muproteobacteria bacterium RIFCSPHIGHO2_01_FULL_65_16 TaxID=1817764 RepID=A0A1F6THV3_9PROT|nr:MAG: YggU family protein [Candidatus Muproteobacteria bacterium RIFCSPHIGHO2_01_FULL_65_16]
MPWFRWDGPDLVLQAQIQPRAGRDEAAEVLGDRIKIRVTAPPAAGAANARLAAFLAREFGVPQNRVLLERGLSGRRKQVRIKAPRRLPAWLPPR